MPDVSAENKENYDIWTELAMVVGFNELARASETLGERVMLRLFRDRAKQLLQARGIEFKETGDNRVLLTIPLACNLSMEFRESDVELMRQAIVKLDAEQKEKINA